MATVQQAFDLALQHHQAGRLADAEALYRQILAVQPNHADAWNNLGALLAGQSRFDEAVIAYRRAIDVCLNFPEAHNNLGIALKAQGRLGEAIAAYQLALKLKPDFAQANSNLGLALVEQGLFDEAVSAHRRAVELKPDYVEAWNNLGAALQELGQLDQAISAYGNALRLNPNHAQAHNNLGTALAASGQLDQAVAAYNRAIQLRPELAETWNNLGNAYRDLARIDHAFIAFRRALECKPDFATAFDNLGKMLQACGKPDEAVAAHRRALELQPDLADAHNNLANALMDRGEIEEAIAGYRRAIQIEPQMARAHSNLIYTLHFQPRQDERAVFEEQSRWNRQFSEAARRFLRPHSNDRSPKRRLRIGYVSPDFRGHVIRHFLTPLLEAHDHDSFEIYCYTSVKHPDATTERLKKTADAWHDVLALSDENLAERIRENRIDVLVDLTQHMADNRLLVFARKPAPVQVAWLGYPASTGLPAMDYRFTDAFLEPVDSEWSKSIDRPVRLSDSWCCFDPIDPYPEPGPLPALTAGHVTFGSLNNFCKVNEGVLQVWAQVLRSVDGSRLLMQCPPGSTQARVRQWFEAHGIAAHRVELVARNATREKFLQLFGRIDIALETFPYNGGTTTCEALWMGVPVPTFPGSSAVSRQGLSILSATGLPELIAAGQEEYLRLTVSLATDLPRLTEMRSTLRQRMKTSAFMDAPRFARNIEAAYRAMWRRWCAESVS